MLDKEIREILIEYLKNNHEEYRIYQEKSIGSAVCDLLLVTDRLTGFEIKSDSDSYCRLPRQVQAYTQFCDENYIVVGMSHAKSATSHVPAEWGILAADTHRIHLLREAAENTSVDRLKQLSVFWKIELRKMLQKNGLPLYSGKNNRFLRQKIADEVEPALLGRQIAESLMLRDYSIVHATDHTIRSGEAKNEP